MCVWVSLPTLPPCSYPLCELQMWRNATVLCSECSDFKHPPSGKIIPFKGVISCTTKNVIYCLVITFCSSIRCRNITYPVVAHFIEAGHAVSALCYLGIERVIIPSRGDDHLFFFFFLIHSLYTNGMNIDFDFKPFL